MSRHIGYGGNPVNEDPLSIEMHYLVHTIALSLEEAGFLFHLLRMIHTQCSDRLTYSVASWSRLFGCTTARFRKLAAALCSHEHILLFEEEGDQICLRLATPLASPKTASWSKENYTEVYSRDGSACRYCRSQSDLSVDHVIPRSCGGGDEIDNLVVACRSCNSKKGARTPEQAHMVLLSFSSLNENEQR